MSNKSNILYGNLISTSKISKVSIKKAISETLENKPQKKKSKRDKSESDSYIIDHQVIYAFFRSDPLINACVSVTTDNVCSDGFETIMLEDSPEAENQKEVWDHFMLMNNWMSQMRNVVMNLSAFDDGFQEIRLEENGTQPSATNIINTTQMKVKQDDDGNLSGYSQIIKNEPVASFEIQEIIHYKLNVFGSERYGLSLIEPVLYTAAAKRFAEMYSAKYFQNQKPRGAWMFPDTLSDDDYDDNVDMIIEAKNQAQKDIFLKGQGIEFKSFTSGEDMQFVEYLSYLRSQIVTSMLVPPIMLGIPEGSNKSNSEVQIQAFDRRVRAIQQSIEYKVNMHLVKFGFKFDKIEFRFKRINKSDKLKDMEIISKHEGIATVDEVRKMSGLPELEDKELGAKIWTKSNSSNNDFGFNEEQKIKSIAKSIKPKVIETITKELAPDQNPIKEKDEKKLSKILVDYIKQISKEINQDLKTDKTFVKRLNNPDDLIQRLLSLFTVSKIKQGIDDSILFAYSKGVDSADKETNSSTQIDQKELRFIQEYNYDLVKNLNEDMKAKLKSSLQRGFIEGKGIIDIKKDIANSLDISIKRAELIARTEMQRAGNGGRLKSYKDSGVEKVQWLAMIDDRTSDICKNLNSDIVKVGSLFKTIVNGKQIAVQHPPAHPNCRSTIIAVVNED